MTTLPTLAVTGSTGALGGLVTRGLTHRGVTFHDETVDEAYASRRKWDAPGWQYDAWVPTYTAIGAGEVERVTDHVRRVTGRAPIRLRELLTAASA